MSNERATDDLQQLFACPLDEYMPVPWWVWTGKLKPGLLKKQLSMMCEQGIREFFIFPIYGMEVEYMSDEYLDRIGMVLEWCQPLGMKVWIYDEYNWPSGTAGGRLARNHPDAVAANLHLERHSDLLAGEIGKLLADASVLHVALVKSDGAAQALTPEILSTSLRRADVAVYRRMKDRTANFTVKGSLWSKGEPGMLDMLSEAACRAYIEEAYEPIAGRFSRYLGSTLKGFFTDEPSIAPGAVPWTDGLPERFRRRFGYDLAPRLHDLTFETETSEQTRADYWSLVTDMHASAYTGQIADWCGAHRLLLTGHMIGEEGSCSVLCQGDTPTHLRHMQVPGCDLLDMQTSFDAPNSWYVSFGAKALIKTPKDPASSARLAGRKRVMCEAYGVAPWTRTMADEKRMTDWLFALGVNLFNDSSLVADISGFRKRAISGKHFTQPWWPKAGMFYTYAGRLSAISAQTTLDTELLVLYPTATWRSMVVRERETSPALRQLELALDATLDALVRKHWPFEFIYEDVLERAQVRDGILVTDCGSFSGIVLAGISRLPPSSAGRLEEFAAAGGTVVLVESEPQAMGAARKLSLPNAVSVREWADPGFPDALDAALEPRIRRRWRITGQGSTGIITAPRTTSDGRAMLFVANMTPGAKDLDIGWAGNWEVEFQDTSTGPTEAGKPRQASNKCSLHLPEDESVWVIQSGRGSSTEKRPPAYFLSAGDSNPWLEIDGDWQFAPDRPNLCKLGLKLRPDPDGSLGIGSPELRLDDSWVDVNEGDAGMPLEPEKMRYYWLRAEFYLNDSVGDLILVADSSDVEKAFLNCDDLGESHPITVWDDENRAWHIGARVRAGSNSLLLRVKASRYNAKNTAIFPTSMVEPVVLRGSFAVDENGTEIRQLPSKIRTGDWRTQGFPHFAGTGVYETWLDWNGPGGDVLLTCDAGRDLVEVLLDGVSLGLRAWGPRYFTAGNLSPGRHRVVVRITNTLGSILRRRYGGKEILPAPPSGLLSPLRITALDTD